MSAGGQPHGSPDPQTGDGPCGSPDEQASNWFAHRRRGELSAVDRSALRAWLAADASHRRAFQRVENVWQQLEALRRDPTISSLRRQASRRVGWKRFGIAACLAVCVAMPFLVQLLLTPRSRIYAAATPKIAEHIDVDGQSSRVYTTAVGEQRAITLADGSIVTLDTDSEARVIFAGDRRWVDLTRGQAFFVVAKDNARPFIVRGGNDRVMAVGTAFDVRLEAHGLSVTLREGRLRVEEPETRSLHAEAVAMVKAADLVPGSKLCTSQAADWQVAKTDVTRELSWLQRRLVFDNARLAAVVTELNRYSSTKIVLGEPSLASVRVSGVFGVDDPGSIAGALSNYGLVRIAESTNATITLLPP